MTEDSFSIAFHFSALLDPRACKNTRHPLPQILFISLCAILCGAEDPEDIEEFAHAKKEWFEQFFTFPYGIPTHWTIRRVFSLLDPKQFEAAFLSWTSSILAQISGLKQIAVDGKKLRGSASSKNDISAITLVSAFACEYGLVLAQEKVSEGSNEITAVPELLKVLYLKGCLVSFDAIHCQKENAKQIIEKEGDYLFSLKKNQENLFNSVEKYFEKAEKANEDIDFYETSEKGHGRLEKRKYWVCSEIEELEHSEEWKELKTIIKVYRKRTEGKKISEEWSYYISSRVASAEEFARFIRNHWKIENEFHWRMDVAFLEDKLTIREKVAGENFSILRRMAFNLLKQENSGKRKLGMKTKMKKAGWDGGYLESLLAFMKF